jgi:peptidoglycan/LPS O-acetylase OafA/YrhL
MKFRQDINGLRAIAVFAVVIFHFNNQWLPGGFSGVDVFFVISGFLMTSIIYKGIVQGDFSIVRFVKSRVRRIVPALLGLCFVLLLVGWFTLTPLDFKYLGKHIVASLSFVSNMIYWGEFGYFNPNSEDNWLLHTWSLAVEFQFYIIYAISIVAFSRLFNIKTLRWVIVIFTFIFFLMSVYATHRSPNAAFYFLPTRMWEFMLGGIAFFFAIRLSQFKKNAIELFGVVLIFFGFITLTKNTLWPGYLSVLPVFGTFLIILSNNQHSYFTNNPVSQWLGKISYSLYLWHWPIVVWLQYNDVHSDFSSLIGIVCSLILASVSYYLIEKKVLLKKVDIFPLKAIYLLFPLCMLFSGYVFYSGGVLERTDNSHFYRSAEAADGDWDYPLTFSIVNGTKVRIIQGNTGKKTLFLGDSLIEQYYPRMHSFSKSNLAVNDMWFITEPGCIPIPGVSSITENLTCGNIKDIEHIFIDYKFDYIVIGGNWFPHFYNKDSTWKVDVHNEISMINTVEGRNKAFELLEHFLFFLKKQSNNVYFIKPTPIGDRFDAKRMSRVKFNGNEYNNSYPKSYFTKKYFDFNRNIDILANVAAVVTFDPVEELCVNDICLTLEDKVKPYYRDSMHMRPFYVLNYVSYLDTTFVIK